jgi:hypothetical protein
MGQPRNCHQAAPRVAAKPQKNRQKKALADTTDGNDTHKTWSYFTSRRRQSFVSSK